MKILKIFQEKLRHKNYSEKSINLYSSYLKNFIEFEGIKDPYQVRTQQIISFLENYLTIKRLHGVSMADQIIETLTEEIEKSNAK